MFIILVSNFHARITSTVILKVAEHSFSSAQRLVSGAMHCGANFSCKTKMATTLIFPCSSRVISLARVFALLQIGRTCCVDFSIAVLFQRKHQNQKIFFLRFQAFGSQSGLASRSRPRGQFQRKKFLLLLGLAYHGRLIGKTAVCGENDEKDTPKVQPRQLNVVK